MRATQIRLCHRKGWIPCADRNHDCHHSISVAVWCLEHIYCSRMKCTISRACSTAQCREMATRPITPCTSSVASARAWWNTVASSETVQMLKTKSHHHVDDAVPAREDEPQQASVSNAILVRLSVPSNWSTVVRPIQRARTYLGSVSHPPVMWL